VTGPGPSWARRQTQVSPTPIRSFTCQNGANIYQSTTVPLNHPKPLVTDISQLISPDAAQIKSALLCDCVYRIGRVMERMDDQTKLLGAILMECRQLFDCEAASLALYDPEAGDLQFTAISGGAGNKMKVFRIPLNTGIVGRVAQERKGMFSNDCHSDPQWLKSIDSQSGFQTHNLAAVPMIRSGELLGVLEVINRTGDEGFTPSDLQLLQIFADQAALAIEIQRLIEARAESERLAGFAIALADIGHSVKNILVGMKIPIQLIDAVHQRRDWVSFEEPWSIMRRATGEISNLVLDMLRYAKPNQPEFINTDIRQLVGRIVETYHPAARSAGIELIVQSEVDSLKWQVDPQILQYALHNLVGNAMEAITGSGVAKGRVRIDLFGGTDALVIRIGDNGPGIPLEIRDRIFKPFFTTKKGKGTGLGLANAKKGVEEHGGQVRLESLPGQGATFILTIPRHDLE
jgi:signal transduction histidine kinase